VAGRARWPPPSPPPASLRGRHRAAPCRARGGTAIVRHRHACGAQSAAAGVVEVGMIFRTALAILSLTLGAADWPNWRGPARNGVSDEKNLPVKWSPTENVAWKL